MSQEHNDRDGFPRRALLAALGALGLSTAVGTAEGAADGDGPSVTAGTETDSDDDGHDHGGDRLGSEEPLAAITARRVNGGRYANAFEGETADEQITGAIEDLP